MADQQKDSPEGKKKKKTRALIGTFAALAIGSGGGGALYYHDAYVNAEQNAIEAYEEGDLDRFKRYVGQIDEADTSGWLYRQFAANGNIDFAQAGRDAGMTVSSRDFDRAYSAAVASGHYDVAEFIEQSPSFSYHGRHLFADAAYKAASAGNIEAMQYAIDKYEAFTSEQDMREFFDGNSSLLYNASLAGDNSVLTFVRDNFAFQQDDVDRAFRDVILRGNQNAAGNFLSVMDVTGESVSQLIDELLNTNSSYYSVLGSLQKLHAVIDFEDEAMAGYGEEILWAAIQTDKERTALWALEAFEFSEEFAATTLSLAASLGQEDIVDYFLERQNITFSSEQYLDAVTHALAQGNADMALNLFEKVTDEAVQANVTASIQNAITSEQRQAAFDFASRISVSETVEDNVIQLFNGTMDDRLRAIYNRGDGQDNGAATPPASGFMVPKR